MHAGVWPERFLRVRPQGEDRVAFAPARFHLRPARWFTAETPRSQS
jgi:hypothetical protein